MFTKSMTLVNTKNSKEVLDYKLVLIWCNNPDGVKEDLIIDLKFYHSL